MLKVIDEHADAAVKSDGFATLERSLLEDVVERRYSKYQRSWNCSKEWSNGVKEVRKRGIVVDGHERRGIIGERILKAIRFSEMKEDEFNSVVVKANYSRLTR